MSEWNNTLFLHCTSEKAVFRALEVCFALDGYQHIQTAPSISDDLANAMRYGGDIDVPVWGVVFMPFSTGWSIVKALPFELFTRYPKGHLRPRVGMLSVYLRCVALDVHFYEGACFYSVEASSSGDCLITGCTLYDLDVPWDQIQPDPVKLIDAEPQLGIHSCDTRPFALHPEFNPKTEPSYGQGYGAIRNLADWLTQCDYYDSIPDVNAAWDNGVQVAYLLRGREVPIPRAKTWYFVR